MDIMIRKVRPEDLNRIEEIEAECFPPAEAAVRESIVARIAAFPESFFVAETEGRIIGFINGCATNSLVIYDEIFHDTSHHIPDGENLSVFGLDVVPGYRLHGVAAKLMNHFIRSAREAAWPGSPPAF